MRVCLLCIAKHRRFNAQFVPHYKNENAERELLYSNPERKTTPKKRRKFVLIKLFCENPGGVWTGKGKRRPSGHDKRLRVEVGRTCANFPVTERKWKQPGWNAAFSLAGWWRIVYVWPLEILVKRERTRTRRCRRRRLLRRKNALSIRYYDDGGIVLDETYSSF